MTKRQLDANPPTGDGRAVIGTWRLVEVHGPAEMHARRGPNPDGMIFYDANGYMGVQIAPDRERGDFKSGIPTPEQAVAAMIGYGAYFGTYSVDPDAGIITHHRIGNLKPGLIGSFDRRYEMRSPDELVLRPVESENALVWRRLT